ncbi:hypothetical protein [Sinomicrobium sp. M5D2P9]
MENIFNDELYPKLKNDKVFKEDSLNSFVHALADIKESVDKIYSKYVPKLLNESCKEGIEEIIWDIREEFRHIEYHIDDANLTNISIDKNKTAH